MSNTLPIDDTFGNYTLKGIEEILPIDPVSWAPATAAWTVLFAALLLMIALWSLRYIKRWKANAYRREAISQLQELKSQSAFAARQSSNDIPIHILRELPSLMKATALSAFPRTDAASLSGNAWLKFLDASYNGPSFQSDVGQNLIHIAYSRTDRWSIDAAAANALIAQCERWISEHAASIEPHSTMARKHA